MEGTIPSDSDVGSREDNRFGSPNRDTNRPVPDAKGDSDNAVSGRVIDESRDENRDEDKRIGSNTMGDGLGLLERMQNSGFLNV